jgi:hypothetical protein
MGRTTLSEPEKTPPATAEAGADAPDARAQRTSPARADEPAGDDPLDDGAEEQASRALLSGLSSVSPPRDLAQSVPALIHRRSQGRFFGRKRLADRLPLEWISLSMLLVLAAAYALLKLLFTD